MPRRQMWATLMAVKAALLSAVAIAAAVVLTRMALPKLVEALHCAGRPSSPLVLMELRYQDTIPLLPVPGLILGIAALMFRPFRALFAILAMLAALVATAGIVALLIGSMAPLYEVPRGLGG
jgi:hypothetical protein